MDLHYILDKLDNEEKVELAQLLYRELNVPDLNLVSSEVGRDRPVSCPHCEGVRIYAHGHYKERRR